MNIMAYVIGRLRRREQLVSWIKRKDFPFFFFSLIALRGKDQFVSFTHESSSAQGKFTVTLKKRSNVLRWTQWLLLFFSCVQFRRCPLRTLLRHRVAVHGQVRIAETRQTSDWLPSRLSHSARPTGLCQLRGSILRHGSHLEQEVGGWGGGERDLRSRTSVFASLWKLYVLLHMMYVK